MGGEEKGGTGIEDQLTDSHFRIELIFSSIKHTMALIVICLPMEGALDQRVVVAPTRARASSYPSSVFAFSPPLLHGQ